MDDRRGGVIAYNEPGLPTLVVGECPLGHVTVDTRLLSNRSDRDQCGEACSEGLTRTKRQSEVIRSR
jgi:hypothetical protein